MCNVCMYAKRERELTWCTVTRVMPWKLGGPKILSVVELACVHLTREKPLQCMSKLGSGANF